MIVYIIRHGKAEHNSDSGADRDRNLADKGHTQAIAIAEFLSSSDVVTPTRVFASPYNRTMQTASHIWSALDLPEQIEDRLAATQSVSELISVIHDVDLPAIALISHNPTVSRAVDVLIHGPSAEYECSMRTGELIALDLDPSNPVGSAKLINQFRLQK